MQQLQFKVGERVCEWVSLKSHLVMEKAPRCVAPNAGT